jgi:hypothetical protein
MISEVNKRLASASVHIVDKRRGVGDNVTWRDVALPRHVTVDGHTSIFVTDYKSNAVHR